MLSSQLGSQLGFTVDLEKIRVNPTQSIEALGTQVNSVKMQFLVPRAKRKSLLRKCFDTLRLNAQHKLTARKYASLIGTLNAVRGAVTSAPLHIWPLLHLQKTVLSKLQSWDQKLHLYTVYWSAQSFD